MVSAAPALHILHIYLSIYLFIYLPTWLVGGGVWSECVVLVHRDHWRCVHLFPCRSMTHTSPSPSIPPPPTIQCLHPPLCPHVITPNTANSALHWREIRSDHYILILPYTYTLPGLGHVPDISYIACANCAKNEELQIGRQWQCNKNTADTGCRCLKVLYLSMCPCPGLM